MEKDKDFDKIYKELIKNYGWNDFKQLPDTLVILMNDIIKATKQVNFISSNLSVSGSDCKHSLPYFGKDDFWLCSKCGKKIK